VVHLVVNVLPSSKLKQFFGKAITKADIPCHSNFEFWNFTYTMPAGSDVVPNLVLDVKRKEI